MDPRRIFAVIVLWGLFGSGTAPADSEQAGSVAGAPVAAAGSMSELAASVRELGLGEGDFVVGARLSDGQFEQARNGRMDDAYPGTIKFPCEDFVVVADERTRLILALYQSREEVRAGAVQEMVGRLMTRFGEPTTTAHGTLIYWAYGPQGKIDAETYAGAKTTGNIEILATVKFNSTLALSPGLGHDNPEETGNIYYIIASDRLLNSYLTSP